MWLQSSVFFSLFVGFQQCALFKGVLPLPAGPAWMKYTRETTSDIVVVFRGEVCGERNVRIVRDSIIVMVFN